MTEVNTRVEEMKAEARVLEDELQRLRMIEALSGELDWTEEDRKGKLEARLAEIRREADELAAARRASAAERKRKAREAEERAREEQHQERRRVEIENDLIRRVVGARRARLFELGLGGANAGGQPKGSAVVAQLARKAEGEIGQDFDAQTQRVLGVAARYVRNSADDHEFGVKLKDGELVVGTPAAPDPLVRSPVHSPHLDQGPSVPQLPV